MRSRGWRTLGLAACVAIVLTVVAGALSQARADGSGRGEVIFRAAYSALSDDRGGEAFTDTLGLNGTRNDGTGGLGIAAALDLSLWAGEDMSWLPGDATVVGEIFVEYSKFSDKYVQQTTGTIIDNITGEPTVPAQSVVSVSQLEVAVAPKVKLNSSGMIQPFVIPIGLAFLVPSPPSPDTTYLDLGLTFAAGIDIKFSKPLSAGLDVRYTKSLHETDTDTSYLSAGGYVAVNF